MSEREGLEEFLHPRGAMGRLDGQSSNSSDADCFMIQYHNKSRLRYAGSSTELKIGINTDMARSNRSSSWPLSSAEILENIGFNPSNFWRACRAASSSAARAGVTVSSGLRRAGLILVSPALSEAAAEGGSVGKEIG